MFAKNSKAYSVYLLFRFVSSLAVSMSTVLSIVYHLEVVQLDAFQLVLVGTVLETSCFLFEMPTGVVADLYSRRRSVLIGMFLYGLGFLMEGALPWFAPVLLAQVVWGCGDTFITGALEAWIASEEEDKPIDKVFLRGSQMGQIGGVLGVVLGTLLGNINLQMPIILGGSLCLLLGLVLVRIMPETNFSPAIEERQGLLKDFVCLFKLNLGFVKGAPVLLALLAITLCGGLASEGFDRLSTAHFLDDTVIPVIGPLNSVTWFGVISLIGSGLGKGYPDSLCREIAYKQMNTDYTATRMLGYLYRISDPRPEDVVDEMLAILSDRNAIIQKKELEHAQATINKVYREGL